MAFCFEISKAEVVETNLLHHEARDLKALLHEEIPKLLDRSFNSMDFNK